MAFEKTYDIQENNEVIVKLPPRFKTQKRVRIIIQEIDQEREEKINLLRKAVNDPIFLSDIKEVSEDFENADKDLP